MPAFTPEMVAPCGLDCSVCSHALDGQNPCPGCHSTGPGKPEFCAGLCPIVYECKKRSRYAFCYECDEFPCAWMHDRDDKYVRIHDYAMHESPMVNQLQIRDEGMGAFLAAQREKFTCPTCGGIICVHDGVCRGCGRAYHK